MTLSHLIILIIAGLLAGFAGGIMGVGGGIVMIPALVFIMGMNQHDAQGTALATMLAPIGIFAVINYYRAGHVNFRYALVLMLAFLAGSWFGSKLAIDLPAKTLKQIFGVLLLLVGAKMILGK